MSMLNAALRGLFDLLLAPFRGMHYLVSLSLVSALFGVIALLVYKYTSNQRGLEEAKRKIFAGLFEVRLYNDDFGAILRAQFDILRHNLTYLRHSLIPLVVMAPPFVLVVAQLQFHYGYRGLAPGATALVKLELREGWEESVPATADGAKPAVEVEVPAGLQLDSPAVWAPATRQIAWRLKAERSGDYELAFHLGQETVTKTVRVSEEVVRLSPVRTDAAFIDQLLYPAEPPLPDASLAQAIHLGYPSNGVWAGMPAWIWLFLLLSIVFGFALKGVFGVTL